MKKKEIKKIKDSTIAVTEAASKELDMIRRVLRKTKRWCLEDLIHEKFVDMSAKNFFRNKCS